MKIGIIGSGAMGSVYAALLGDAGHDVWMFDRWAEHIEAVRRAGIRVEGASGDRTVRVSATCVAEEAGPCDLAVVATKAMDTGQAVRDGAAMVGPDTLILTLQNGLGNAEQIAQVHDRERILVGIAGGFGAAVVAPGHVFHENWKALHMAELQGPITPRLERTGRVWSEAGFKVGLAHDVDSMVWGKLLGNIAVSAPCAVSRLRIGQLRANTWAWGNALGCVRETLAVAQAKGIELPHPDPFEWLEEFVAALPTTRPSMLQDVEAGRPTEIDFIHGGVVREGETLGVPTPTCRVMVSLVKALEDRTRELGSAFGSL